MNKIRFWKHLKSVQPKVIYFDNQYAIVWGEYKFSDYAPCVYNFIKGNYLPLSWDRDVYILKKVIEQRPDLPIKIFDSTIFHVKALRP
jgi:hypothetical protein